MDNEENSKLPKLSDLYSNNTELVFKNDQFNLLVNQEPPVAWIRTNKYAGDSKYIPIGILETTMQRLFKKYRIEILREGNILNSVFVVVRVHFKNLISNDWDFHDGVGAVPLQTRKDTDYTDMDNIVNSAVMMALPMAKSYAIKDALEHIGKLFGRDLNRKDTIQYIADRQPKTVEEIKDKKNKIKEKQSKVEMP